ncbi:MAG: hypothetical protein GEV08_15680 [Acidimicrobiia bacterium]|nr:hypothetical protein [Acidimicrobiia bacterium]
MTAPDAPERTLAAARIVLDRKEAFGNASWHRSSALLARQALEAGIDRFWQAQSLEMRGVPRKRQLICLPWYLEDAAAARQVHETWAGLSNACHHHAYDLAPTAVELRAWFNDVAKALRLLDQSRAAEARPRREGAA